MTFVISHVITLITRSKPQKTDRWWSFIINLYISKIGSHNLWGSGDYIVFYLSRDSMSPCDFRVMRIGWVWSLSFTHQSAKCGGHKSRGSGSILIFDVRRRIRMIILLQKVAMQFRRLFWHISFHKVQQTNFISKYDRLFYEV